MSLLQKILYRNKALLFPYFRRFLALRLTIIMALTMQNVILAYWIYSITDDVKSVGLIGLFEAIPAIGCSLFSGYMVDKREKRRLLLTCLSAYVMLSAYFGILALRHAPDLHLTVPLVYTGIFIGGVIRAFLSPSTFSLLGLLLPKKFYPNGSTWSSSSWQTGAVLGPLAGGLLIGYVNIPAGLFAVTALVFIALFICYSIPPQRIVRKDNNEGMLESLKQGARFIRKQQIILSALSLDMFAVLFGGATALLPAYAKDILHVGEIGYGWLRAASGIGALGMYFILAFLPLKTRPGIKLLGCIAAYGVTIIVFGLSTNVILSFIMLLLGGMVDAVSVVIRGTLLQLYTPDDMRGRVSAIGTMFVSSSNELGEVESGFTAEWLGTKEAVVAGGCMTIAVVGVTWFAAPKIRDLKRLEAPERAVS